MAGSGQDVYRESRRIAAKTPRPYAELVDLFEKLLFECRHAIVRMPAPYVPQ